VEALRLSLQKLEGLLKEHAPMMGGSMEKAMDKAIKYGAVFAEVSSSASTSNEQEIDTC